MRAVLVAIAFVAIAIAIPHKVASQSAPMYCCVPSGTPTPTPTPTPSPIPQYLVGWFYNCGTGNTSCGGVYGADPGPSADPYAFYGVEQLGSTRSFHQAVLANCPGCYAPGNPKQGSPIQAIYNEETFTNCSGDPFFAWFTVHDENWFYHNNSSGNREVSGQEGNCNPTGTGPTSSPNSPQVFGLNPLDSQAVLCWVQHLQQNTNSCDPSLDGPIGAVDTGEGVNLDSLYFLYRAQSVNSKEYGAPQYPYLACNNGCATPTPWTAAVANIPNALCTVSTPVCTNFLMKIGDATTDQCLNGTTQLGTDGKYHCLGSLSPSYSPGTYDNRIRMDEFCSALTNHNFRGVTYEDPIARNAPSPDPNAGNGAANDYPTIEVDLNTVYWNQAHHANDDCGVPFVSEEQWAWTYTQQRAFVAMAPGADGTDSEIIPFRTVNSNNSTTTDVGYYVDYGVRFSGPIEAPGPYTYGGTTTKSSSTYCDGSGSPPTPSPVAGESGGVQNLVVACGAKHYPVLRIEYTDSLSMGTDHGQVGIIWNTSNASVQVQPSWLQGTYNSTFSFLQCNVATNTQPCEGAYLPASYGASMANAINTTCSNTTFCCAPNCSSGINWSAGSFSCTVGNPSACPTIAPFGVLFVDSGSASNNYVYHGCTMYGGNDSVINYNVSTIATDSHSAAVLAKIASMSFAGGDTSSLERTNLGLSTTAQYTVATNGGHNPPISTGVYGGGSGAKVPWINGTPAPPGFVFEGQYTQNCSGNDCHWTTLTTDNCYLYAGGGGTWTSPSGPFKTFDGFIDNLNAPYSVQFENKLDNGSVAGIWGPAFTLNSEDMSLGVINHPIAFDVAVAYSDPTACYNYCGGGGNDAGTCVGGANCPGMGDIFAYTGTCPTTPAIVLVVCTEATDYGIVLTDTRSSGAAQFRMSQDTSGNDDIPASVVTWLNGITASQLRLVQRQSQSYFGI